MLPQELAPSALESAPDAIVLVDESGSVVFANRQLTAVFGYGSDEILGQPVEHLLPERFRDRHVGHRTGFAQGPRVRPMGVGLQLAARRKDGSEFPVEISLSPIRDGDRTLVAAAIRDVTDRRRIDAELVAAREAADHANQAKSRFLATASHDLRQPLQALSLLNGTLRRLPSDPQVSDALAQQELAITGMSRLVNALLDISKLESGAIRPEITDFTVATVFEEMRREFASLAADKGLELEVECCAEAVCSDPSLIGQILRNLVSNAIKYTRRGRILLRCLHAHSFVRLEVLDTGIGIPAEQLPYIYDEFYQVRETSGTARGEGYGLGLSIVSRLVQLLHLKLDVRSEPGKGSRFWVDVPASRDRSVATDAPAAADAGGGTVAPAFSPRVLLVEDHDGVRNAMRMLLKAEGYDVTTAASRAEALQRLGELPGIDLLIADYHLGGETGLDVIAALRDRIGADLPAILVSGDTSPLVQALERDERLAVVSKPIQAGRLLALIGELLAGRNG